MNRLYKLTWRISGTDYRAVIRADNASAALTFARKHYGDTGPLSSYQIGPITERQAVHMRCDQLNADQLTLEDALK